MPITVPEGPRIRFVTEQARRITLVDFFVEIDERTLVQTLLLWAFARIHVSEKNMVSHEKIIRLKGRIRCDSTCDFCTVQAAIPLNDE